MAEAGFFGPRSPELLERFKHMGTEAPLSLEQHIELGTLLCGTPDTVIEQMRHIHDELGAGVLSLNFEISNSPEQIRATMRRFASDVLPRMHDIQLR